MNEIEARPEVSGEIVPGSTSSLIALAIEKDLDVEKLERLIAMKVAEDERGKLAELKAALSAARPKFPDIEKNRQGQHSTKKPTEDGRTVTVGNFASLQDISEQIDPVLEEHGLGYRWDRETIDGKAFIVFYVEHENGAEQARSKFPDIVDEGRGRSAIQSVASGETFAKRYSLLAGLGLTTVDPDDDGQKSGAGQGDIITEDQGKRLDQMVEEASGGDRKWGDAVWGRLCKHFDIAQMADLPASKFPEASQMIGMAAEARKKRAADASA